jgi:hypothetical protein
MPEVLNYSTPRPPMPMLGLLRAATACGLAPVTAGLLTMCLWLVTGHDAWESLGILTIVAGCILISTGLLCLAIYRWYLWRDGLSGLATLSRRELAILLLLLVNFPAAGACVTSALWIMDRYTVLVVNDTDSTVENSTLSGLSINVDLGTIQPRSSLRYRFEPHGQGSLHFSAVHNGHPTKGTLDAYLSGEDGRFGADAIVTISDNGVVFERRRQ